MEIEIVIYDCLTCDKLSRVFRGERMMQRCPHCGESTVRMVGCKESSLCPDAAISEAERFEARDITG